LDEVFVIEDVFAIGGGGWAFDRGKEAGEHGEDSEEGGFHSQSQDGGADEVLGSGGHRTDFGVLGCCLARYSNVGWALPTS
jgi:hypothetical protein